MVQEGQDVLTREVVEVEVARSLFGSRRYSDLENSEVEAEVGHLREPMMLLNLLVVEVEVLLLCFARVAEVDWRAVSCLRMGVELDACLQMEAGLHAFPSRRASLRPMGSFEAEVAAPHCSG
jgi:hypothetical protein